MIITPTPTTQLNLTIVLTEEEAREAIHTPDKLQTALRKSLAQIRAAQSDGRGWTDSFFLTEKKMRGSTKPGPKGGRRRAGGTRAFTKEPCPKCGKTITSHQLPRHLKSCPGTAAPADSN